MTKFAELPSTVLLSATSCCRIIGKVDRFHIFLGWIVDGMMSWLTAALHLEIEAFDLPAKTLGLCYWGENGN